MVEICLVDCVEILTNKTVVRVPCFIRVFLVVQLLLVLSSVSGWAWVGFRVAGLLGFSAGKFLDR